MLKKKKEGDRGIFGLKESVIVTTLLRFDLKETS